MNRQNNDVRNGEIDFWKFIFSLLIILCHISSFYWIPAKLSFKGASIGVEFFFLVSGYLMAKSSVKYKDNGAIGTDTIMFIRKKISNIFPYYIFAFILSFVAERSIMKIDLSVFMKDLGYSIWDLFFLRMSGLRGNNIDMVVGGSWYLSAMFISMLILFPLIRKNKDLFFNVIAPIIVIFTFGYFSQTRGDIKAALEFDGAIPLGLLRAVAVISLGCICFKICERMKSRNYNLMGKVFLALIECICFFAVFIHSYYLVRSQIDFVNIILLAIAITIVFSQKSIISALFLKPIFAWLGSLSLALYLNHVCWSRVLNYLNMGYAPSYLFVLYLLLTFTSSFACIYTINFLKEAIKIHYIRKE